LEPNGLRRITDVLTPSLSQRSLPHFAPANTGASFLCMEQSKLSDVCAHEVEDMKCEK